MTVEEEITNVMGAKDLEIKDVESENITEPLGALKGLKRVTKREYISVSLGKKVIETISYMYPASSTAWGARGNSRFEIVNL